MLKLKVISKKYDCTQRRLIGYEIVDVMTD